MRSVFVSTLAGVALATLAVAMPAAAQDVPTLQMSVPFAADATWTAEGVKAVEAAVNPILEQKIGAHVQINPVLVSDYNQRMTLMMSAREPFDLAMTAPWTNNFYQNVSQSNFVALDQFEAQVPELQQSVSADLLKVGKVAGQQYGVPIEQLFPKGFGFNIRTDLAKKYNVDVKSITSFEQLTPIFEEIVKGEGQGFYAFAGRLAANPEIFGYDPILATGLYAPLVVKADDPTHKVVSFYETKEFRDLMALRRQWHEAGLTNPDPMNRDQAWATITAKTSGFNLDSAQERPSHRVFLGMDFTPKSIAPFMLTTASMNASMWAVSADSQHPVEALKLIALLHSDAEVFNIFARGVEGTNWQWNADHSLIEKTDKASYNPNIDWVWGKSYLAYPIRATDAADVAESEKMNKEATPSLVLGFAFDNGPVESQIAGLSSVVANFAALENGQVADVDGYIAEQVAALKAAGLDDVMAEAQRQVDAWAANP